MIVYVRSNAGLRFRIIKYFHFSDSQSMLKFYIERSIDKSNDRGSDNISSIPTPDTEMTLEESS